MEVLTRSEMLVLASLRNAPFGLVSVRAVARRSGLSPTTAARSLESLRVKGLAQQTTETVAAGRVQKMKIWHANPLHPRRAALDPLLDRVEMPERPGRPERAGGKVPRRLRHLFWNTAESQLDVEGGGTYIYRPAAVADHGPAGAGVGAQALAPEDWERAALARGLDPKVKQLARNLAACSSENELRRPPRSSPTKPRAPAGLHDLMAMKIKVMAERGEMRDYFDVKAIDETGAISVEEGVELYMRRYGIDPSSEALSHLYRTMGDLSDVEVDDLLPIALPELQRWWSMRQVRVLRNSDRFG